MNKLFEVGKKYVARCLPSGFIVNFSGDNTNYETPARSSRQDDEVLLVRIPDDYFPRWIPGDQVQVGDEIEQPEWPLGKCIVKRMGQLPGHERVVFVDNKNLCLGFLRDRPVILHSRQPVKKEMTAEEAEEDYFRGKFCALCKEEKKPTETAYACSSCWNEFGLGDKCHEERVSAVVIAHLENLGLMKPVSEAYCIIEEASYADEMPPADPTRKPWSEWLPKEADSLPSAWQEFTRESDETTAFRQNLTIPHVGDTIFITSKNADGEVLSVDGPIVEVRLNFRDKTGRVFMVEKQKFDLMQGGWGLKSCPHKTAAPKPSVITPLQIDNPQWPIIRAQQ